MTKTLNTTEMKNIIESLEKEIEKQPRGLAGYHAEDLVKNHKGFYIVHCGKNVSLFHKNDMLVMWLDLSGGESSLPHTTKFKKTGTQWAAFEGETKLGRFDDVMEAREACVLAQA